MMKSHFRIQNDEDVEEEEFEPEGGDTPQQAPDEEIVLTHSLDRRLDRYEVGVRLSWLGKTADGDGYSYLKATCTGMGLNDISALQLFQYLQFIDVSDNNLTIEALQAITKLPFLVFIQADRNNLISAYLPKCKYLQVMILNYNEITSVENVYHTELSTLEVGYNKIMEIKFANRMEKLRVLDFRYNFVTQLPENKIQFLDSMYLAGNKIKILSGLQNFPNLRILHLRNNPIRLLDGFEVELPKLEYLNLRNCKVGTIIQVKKLRPQKSLKTLILKGTPFMGGEGKEDPEAADEEEDPEQRVEVLASLPRLIRLNKAEYTEEERAEAKDLMAQWLEDGENDEEEVVEEVAEEHAEEHIEQ